MHCLKGLVGGIPFNKKLIMCRGDEDTGGGKVGKGSPRLLHNNTLAPWEYFRMCGLLKSEWKCHHKSVTPLTLGGTKPRENIISPTKWL